MVAGLEFVLKSPPINNPIKVATIAAKTIVGAISPFNKAIIRRRTVLEVPNINPSIRLNGFIFGLAQLAIVGMAMTV